ncbi:MAG: nickel pincer cofactor biosynthesis protein LarC [Planctomycetales bacterium]|nr:nickel pincer cofactor biosynthesis protein LarC [Planctomycetales bacterium]
MRIAYLDCASGISGDMMLGALVDAGVALEAIQRGVDSLQLPNCLLVAEETKRKGFRALHVNVEHEPEHAHRHLSHIVGLIEGSALTGRQQDLAKRIFLKLAEAEAKVHGTTVEKVHFHEVGAVDSIADIVGSAIGWDLLAVDRVIASPVPTGAGSIEIAHGRCAIPAPATAELLMGIPLADCQTPFELTTPTGAAILATLVESFGPLPAMAVDSIGYGAGTRELDDRANVLRLLVGEAANKPAVANRVWQIETNLDDCSGEWIGHAVELLWQAGALDVTTSSIQMKKNRPGVKLVVLCNEATVSQVETVLFRETTTLGIRRWPVERTTVEREATVLETPWGPVDGVRWQTPDGRDHCAPEFESARRLAQERNVPLPDVYQQAKRAETRRKT